MSYEESQQLTADAQPRVFLQPLAAPSILGLFGLAGATFLIGVHMAHWYNGAIETTLLIPFAAFLGGLAQFLAGMWAYKARDGVATAVHGTWGAFWMAFGVMAFIFASGRVVVPVGGVEAPLFSTLGYWFIVMAAISWACTGAAAAENAAMVTTLAFLSAGATVSAVGLLTGVDALLVISGYLFIICAIAAWYTATALMVNEAFGRQVWSLGRSTQSRRMPSIAMGIGEPGVIRGQA